MKIDESDGVVMLNIDGYLGESSLRELAWARIHNKHVFWTIGDKRQFPETYKEGFARRLIYPHESSGVWIELLDAVELKMKLRRIER